MDGRGFGGWVRVVRVDDTPGWESGGGGGRLIHILYTLYTHLATTHLASWRAAMDGGVDVSNVRLTQA